MMRSLFSGVSGLKNHQVKMDVIGNNIANINTIGFKSGRVTFEENLTQLLQGAARPHDGIGGRNPMQVGLGMAVASIDTNFTQGNLESTGNITDLAIQGEAFFVLSNGASDFYSRAGNFQVDGEGRLVSPANGYVVQGVMADSSGEIVGGSGITDIILPFGQKSPARSTTSVEYACNLDSDTYALEQILSSNQGMTAMITASGVPTTLTLDATNNALTIEVDDDQGSTLTRNLTLTEGTYATLSSLAAEINNQISNDLNLAGEVVAEVVDSGGTDVLRLRTTDKGGSSTELTLSGNACANLNLGTTKVIGTDATTALNVLPHVTGALTAGDEVTITGTNPDGTEVTTTYTYADGDTVQDLMDVINAAFSGATATISAEGKMLISDSVRGESNTTLVMSLNDADNSGSVMTIPAFRSDQAGRDAGTHTTSITVYDSKGDTHSIALSFTNISTDNSPNVWSWETTIDGGDITPTAGSTGTVRFNNDGSIAAFNSDDGQMLAFDPGNGTDAMNVTLESGTQNGFDGITQMRSATTTIAKHQDGYAMGNLQTISIDSAGKITGFFTNGISQVMAQISLATFNNPTGLMRAGDNLYQMSGNSGTPVKGLIGSGIQGEINSGTLEMSNVDLAQEFTDMIVAQRGFQASSRVITTADTLLDEVVRLKR